MRRVLTAFFVAALSGGVFAQESIYKLGPDSQRQPGVPQGKVTKLRWEHSAAYPNVEYDWWIYVPAQYDSKTPAALMVLLDGAGYASETGPVRAPTVFDNLIHAGAMPVTIGVFINAGRAIGDKTTTVSTAQRSIEYDTVSDKYARFLLEEIIPEVRKTYRITDNPDGRGIGGISSGGIAAFTVAWQRPDQFRKVVSHVGSFANIRGGQVYPDLIRNSPPKPIRVFLQDGTKDLDWKYGNWFLNNQQMASALAFAKYDFKTAWGEGGHNLEHGGAIFPDTMRWLWRDYVARP